jgi:hypothetical protein
MDPGEDPPCMLLSAWYTETGIGSAQNTEKEKERRKGNRYDAPAGEQLILADTTPHQIARRSCERCVSASGEGRGRKNNLTRKDEDRRAEFFWTNDGAERSTRIPASRTPHISHPTPRPPLPLPPSRASRSDERSPHIRTARMALSPAIRKARALSASPALPSVALLLTAHSDTDTAIERRKSDHARAMTPAPGNRYNADGRRMGGATASQKRAREAMAENSRARCDADAGRVEEWDGMRSMSRSSS